MFPKSKAETNLLVVSLEKAIDPIWEVQKKEMAETLQAVYRIATRGLQLGTSWWRAFRCLMTAPLARGSRLKNHAFLPDIFSR